MNKGKIVTNGDTYKAVIDEIIRREGYTGEDYIVRLNGGYTGVQNVVMTGDGMGGYCFDTDWYEGGEVELLGYIKLDDVKVTDLK